MKIIEHFSQAKTPHSDGEDGWVMTEHYAAVIDGSTSKAGQNFPDHLTPGRKAMLTVREAIRSLHPEAELNEVLEHLTQALHNITAHASAMPPEWRPTCSAAIYSAHRNTICLIGDCQCIANNHLHQNSKLVDSILSQVRADVLHHLLALGHTEIELRQNDLGRQFIMDALRDQTAFANDCTPCNPYAYPVLNGIPIRPAEVVSIEVESAEIVLATDGYPDLRPTLAASESALQTLLTEDPLCIRRNASTKGLTAGNVSFDDRTYLRLHLC